MEQSLTRTPQREHYSCEKTVLRPSGGTTHRADSSHICLVRADRSVATERSIERGAIIALPVDAESMSACGRIVTDHFDEIARHKERAEFVAVWDKNPMGLSAEVAKTLVGGFDCLEKQFFANVVKA